ncbi:MAG: hypothetical protein RXN92_05165 [Thermoplasmatales archaeon]
MQYLLSVISGFPVGLSLGIIGGGGTILAVHLLLYFVRLAYSAHTRSYENYVDHVVMGTTALAVD